MQRVLGVGDYIWLGFMLAPFLIGFLLFCSTVGVTVVTDVKKDVAQNRNRLRK